MGVGVGLGGVGAFGMGVVLGRRRMGLVLVMEMGMLRWVSWSRETIVGVGGVVGVGGGLLLVMRRGVVVRTTKARMRREAETKTKPGASFPPMPFRPNPRRLRSSRSPGLV